MSFLKSVTGAVGNSVNVATTVGRTAISPVEKTGQALGSAVFHPVDTMKAMGPKESLPLQQLEVGPRIAQYGNGFTVWGAGKRQKLAQMAVVIWRTENGSWSAPIQFDLDPTFDNSGWIALPYQCVPPFYYCVAVKPNSQSNHVYSTDDILLSAKTYHVPAVTRDPSSIKVAAMSCRYSWSGVAGGFTNLSAAESDQLFTKVIEQGPYDVALMLGDQIYADPLSDKPIVCQTAAKSFTEYCDKYRENFSTQWFSQLAATTPTYMVIDDHEFWNDFNGVQSLTDDGKIKRYEAALNAIRSYQYRVTERVMDPSRPELWYTFQHNAFRFFALDCRTCRLGRSMLGGKQTNDFFQWLSMQQPNQISCVMSSVPLLPLAENNDDYNSDKWSGFPDSLGALRNALDDSTVPDGQLKRVVFFTGDYHLSTWVTLLSPGRKVSIHFIVASPVKAVMARKAALSTKVPMYFDGWTIHSAPENEIVRQDSLFTSLDINFQNTNLQVFDKKGKLHNSRSLAWGV